MLKADSSVSMLVLAAILALGVGYWVPKTFSARPDGAAAAQSSPTGSRTPKGVWAASAPGRVEPAGGEIRISAQVPGRIAEVLVGVNDKVVAGDLLVRFADEELAARVHAAQAEAAIRKRDRDNEGVGRAAQDRRTAEDGVATAERQLAIARDEVDRLLRARRSATGGAGDLDKARDTAAKAVDKLDQTRATLRRLMAGDTPTPTRLEAALVAARAELSLAQAALDRTRVRASSTGTVLQVNAKAGETATPTPEIALAVIGDLSSLRVRAEFEERDVGKVILGQVAIVRSDAFAGQEYEGKVASLALALAPSRLGQRGPRRPTDVDVLEVLIELAGQPPLLPGMRVDVFLKPDAGPAPAAAKQSEPATKTN
jgi:HlyD family secretion protein